MRLHAPLRQTWRPTGSLTIAAGCFTAILLAAPVPFQARLPALGGPLSASLGLSEQAAEDPTDFGQSPDLQEARFGAVDRIVEEAIGDGLLPGAVVLVGNRHRTLYVRAYGHRAVAPAPEAMSVDTIFDLASLTKVVATAPSVMLLAEQGRLRLDQRVGLWVPRFDRLGKQDITIRHLLTHRSGLRPDLDLDDPWTGSDTALDLVVDEVPVARPGERFIYSDINFILLGELVSRASGVPLDRFADEHLFVPLGMRDTSFRPSPQLRSRIAPTEPCTPYGWPCDGPGAVMLRGTVHDPTSRRMSGLAGHAGLFSTAEDLARFCRMFLSGGALDGAQILSPLTVAAMTEPATPPDQPDVRGLGWDVDSRFSANRGDLFPAGLSFGHTGFTGTSLWIDPATETFVVFLSSRLHPDGQGDVTDLRARVATAVAATVSRVYGGSALVTRVRAKTLGSATQAAEPVTDVRAGIDVLVEEDFGRLRGKRIGLLTNQAGRSRSGASTIDVLHAASGVELRALFSPEHGIRGTFDTDVPSSKDRRTGLPIHSLYGEHRRPTQEMLEGLDLVVVDLQDVGSRFYTFMTTMAYVMEEAARYDVAVVVLDRPNPITGREVEGPGLDDEFLGFTGYVSMPIRHGLTLGELARLFNSERGIGADLEVVSLQGWRRDLWFDGTGLPWTNPSPNMRSLTEATLYPGIGAIEGTNISVGRGTDTPFEQIGAPWIDGVALAALLNARRLPGVRFYPVTFVPRASKYSGERCQGVSLVVTDRERLRPVRIGLEMAVALVRLHGPQFDLDSAGRLFGSAETLERVRAGEDPARIAADWVEDEASWRRLTDSYLLYR